MNIITQRESHFELLRIICMLLIIWGHLTNIYSWSEPETIKGYLKKYITKVIGEKKFRTIVNYIREKTRTIFIKQYYN